MFKKVRIFEEFLCTFNRFVLFRIEDTHRETAPSQKLQALTKNMKIEILVIVA